MSATKIRVGTLDEVRHAPAMLVALAPRDGRPRQAIVLLDEAGTPRAYLNECRHIPVPLDGGSGYVLDHTKRFLMCGTHGALYHRRDGLCVTGPCRGERLLPLVLKHEGDTLYVLDQLDSRATPTP